MLLSKSYALNNVSVFVDFVIRHTTRILRIILSSLSCLPLPYLLRYFIKGRVIENNEHNVLLDFPYKVSLTTFPFYAELPEYRAFHNVLRDNKHL